MTKRILVHIIFSCSLLLTSCALPSGHYVQRNGQWQFIEKRVGFNYILSTPDVSGNFDASKDGAFLWPVPSSFKVTSQFGPRGGHHHDGIDIGAKIGSAIVAADSGKVIFSGRMRGYGKVVVIKHKTGYHTVYGHNSSNLVSKGQNVSQGEVIAKVGQTGRASGPHLHFEIRKKNRVHNPSWYLSRAKKSLMANK